MPEPTTSEQDVTRECGNCGGDIVHDPTLSQWIHARDEQAQCDPEGPGSSLADPCADDEADQLRVEVERLRAELAAKEKAYEWADMLTHQECQNKQHADWWVDSEHDHLCPWCAIAKAEAERDQLRRGGKELGELVVHLGGLIKGAFVKGADDPIGALHMLGDHLAELLDGEGGLPVGEHNRVYAALTEWKVERDRARDALLKLAPAARAALESLDMVIRDHGDPGTQALGDRHTLAQALIDIPVDLGGDGHTTGRTPA